MSNIIDDIDDELISILEYCAHYARGIMVVAAHSTYGSENSKDYDEGLRTGIIHSLSPMFREVFDLDDDEQRMLETALDSVTESACLSVRCQAQTIGRS